MFLTLTKSVVTRMPVTQVVYKQETIVDISKVFETR
jgi:hypothetical protein